MRLDAATTAALDDQTGLGDFWSKLGDNALTYGGAIATAYGTGDIKAALAEAQKAKAAKDAINAQLEAARAAAANPSAIQQLATSLGIQTGASASPPVTSSGVGSAGAGTSANTKGLLIVGGGLAAATVLVLVLRK